MQKARKVWEKDTGLVYHRAVWAGKDVTGLVRLHNRAAPRARVSFVLQPRCILLRAA